MAKSMEEQYAIDMYIWAAPPPVSALKYNHDAYFTPYRPVTDEYPLPPNDQWQAGYNKPHFEVDASLQMPGYWPGTAMTPAEPYPRTFFQDPYCSRTLTCSSNASTDSLSSRASEERRLSDQVYVQFGPSDSPFLPRSVYASPEQTHASLSPNCPGVTPQDIQQHPDVFPDEQLVLEPVANPRLTYTENVAEPSAQTIDTGLPTPTSGTVATSIEAEQIRKVCQENDSGDTSGDFTPPRRKVKARKIKAVSLKAPPLRSRPSKRHRVTKSFPKICTTVSIAASPVKPLSPNQCTTCGQEQTSKNALSRHMQLMHVRPFTCIFDIYGCPATFGAKNEWKRHCSTQHLHLHFYRCDLGACVPQKAKSQCGSGWDVSSTTPQANWNDFNRKDLFIQHHRRMHAPKGISNATQAERDRFKADCETSARRCLVTVRRPPPKTSCPFCMAKRNSQVFDSWEARMEHIGRHLEKNKGERIPSQEDLALRQWLIDEHLLQSTPCGQWRLTDLMKTKEPLTSRL